MRYNPAKTAKMNASVYLCERQKYTHLKHRQAANVSSL